MAKRVPIANIRCEGCGVSHSPREACPSCNLYNAAVTAQNAAAQEIARNYDPSARDAWLNEHGVFAWIDDVTVQVGSFYEAQPFVRMTAAARHVVTFQTKKSPPKRSAE